MERRSSSDYWRRTKKSLIALCDKQLKGTQPSQKYHYTHGLTTQILHYYNTNLDPQKRKLAGFLVQYVVGVGFHPAITHDPRGPEDLNLLREGPKRFLQNRNASVRVLCSQDERDTREPCPDVEVVHPRAVPADERSLGDRRGKGLDSEGLDGIPEGSGRGEGALLDLVGCLAVEESVETRDRNDPLVIERLVCLPLGCHGIPFQISEPCERTKKKSYQ